MTDALIGRDTFVGAGLLRHHQFDTATDLAEIDGMRGRSFDLVVCAGAAGDRHAADVNPEADLNTVERLTGVLEHVNTRKLVLVSTVDVFQDPVGVDETSQVHVTGLHPFGRHRRLLEEIAASRFDATIVRLPTLYGPGLQSNVLHDLVHDANLRAIDSRSIYQFYDVDRLWSDIRNALDLDLSVLHLAPEPVSIADVARVVFSVVLDHATNGEPARYDVQTEYAALFGGEGRYIMAKDAVVRGIERVVSRER